MPTVLRTFPEISRVGHQETAWSGAIPANVLHLHILGVAADAVWSNAGNSMDFRIFVSPDGVDANPLNKEVFLERWRGGTHVTKPIPPGTVAPNRLNITFGPFEQPGGPHYIGWRIKLAVDIPVAMVVGATVTSIP